MAAVLFNCNLCAYNTDQFVSFKSHFVRKHKNDPNFHVACCIDSCSYTSRNWSSYRVHVHRKHRQILSASSVNLPDQDDDLAIPDEHLENPADFNGRFTLALAAQHNLSHLAIDKIVSSTNILVHSHLNFFKEQVKSQLLSHNINLNVLDDIPVDTYLSQFSSHKKRQTFYTRNVKTYVEPKEVVLGYKFVSKAGTIKSVPRIAYIIPFEKSLKNMLNMSEVWHYACNPHHSNDEYMRDMCDGDFMKNDVLFSHDTRAIPIILNCDDMELVNPLGSHVKKHKVSMFYYSLACIPPEYRSRLDAIQLLAVAKTRDVREGNNIGKLLGDFCDTVNRLSDEGVDMDLHGSMHKIKGALCIVSADTLAANWLGKFKEGVSFATRNCRRCDIENSHISRYFVERDVPLRSLAVHKTRCMDLAQLTANAKQYWSRTWGINGTSCLLQINGFDLTAALVQDPMHVLLEGVFPHELSQVLYNFIFVEKLFSLKWLNSAIARFTYSYMHCKSKPEPIEKHHLDGKGSIKQTAAAMLTLAQTLPLVVGQKVPRENANWQNTLRLIQIVIFATSTYCSKDTPFYLRTLIAEYLSNFKLLYPRATFIPKMHYMLHLPSQMVAYGPLRHQWCMRYEGKNGFFAGKKYKNFKNLPLSLAMRHQLYMAYMQSGCENGQSLSYLYDGDDVGSGIQVVFSERFCGLAVTYDELQQSEVYLASTATIHGLEYRTGCALVLRYCDDEPVFGILEHVVVRDHAKYFIVRRVETIFDMHILSYVIEETCESCCISYFDLNFKWPLSVYSFQGSQTIMNIDSHTYCCPS